MSSSSQKSRKRSSPTTTTSPASAEKYYNNNNNNNNNGTSTKNCTDHTPKDIVKAKTGATSSPVNGSSKSLENDNERRRTLYKPAPFSDDDETIKERDSIEHYKITLEMASAGTAGRPIRIYSDGIYDLFHQGHSRQLMQAKSLFPNVYLIVGICSDQLTHKRKGKTVMNETERYEAVRHCRYVDEVLTGAPWTLDMDFIKKYKIDFVAHDEEPYTTGNSKLDIYAFLKERDMFVATQRTEGVSTSDVVARIVKDYDVYVRRNLARGYTAKDLNVSYIKEKKIKLERKMESLKETGKRVLDNWDEKTTDIIHKWEDKSRDFIHSFLLLFGREGRISHMWTESRGRLLNALSPPGSPAREDINGKGKPCTSAAVPWSDDDSEENEVDDELPKKRRRIENYFSLDDDSDEEMISGNLIKNAVKVVKADTSSRKSTSPVSKSKNSKVSSPKGSKLDY